MAIVVLPTRLQMVRPALVAGALCLAVAGCGDGRSPRVGSPPVAVASTVSPAINQPTSTPTPTTLAPIPPVMPTLPAHSIKTGIVDFGPQISSTRWQQVNGWAREVTPTTELTVWGGGATIEPSLPNPPSLAAVLVITATDYATVTAKHQSLQELGTIYYPPGHPMGKLKVIAANGNVLTVSLLGTTQTYQFNVVTDAFS
jgi:hypothetical protein